MSSLPSHEDHRARWSALHAGYDPGRSVLVDRWLHVLRACARPVVALGVSPDVVTCCGVAVSALALWPAAAGGAWLWLAAGLVLLAGLLDGLDGAVAVLGDRTTRWGFVLDSVADRLSDVLFLLALWLAGAPAAVCVGAGAVSSLLEYTRARAMAGGMAEIGVVTVAERPTRVLVAAGFLAAAGARQASADAWVGAGAWVWLGVSALGLVQLLVVVRRRLHQAPPG